MTAYAGEIQGKTASEVCNVAVSFVGKLDSGENLTGAPTVAEIGSVDLVISNIVISTAELTILGRKVPVGRAVQFRVSGGTAGKRYVLKVTAGTNANPAQTRIVNLRLDVEADS